LPPHREQVETAISRPSPQVPLGPGPARGDNPGSTRAGPTPDDCEVPSGLYYPGWADRQAFHIQHTVCEAGTRYRRSEDNPAPRAGSIGRVQGSKPLGQECRRQHPGVYLLGSQIFLSPWSVVLAPELCLAAYSLLRGPFLWLQDSRKSLVCLLFYTYFLLYSFHFSLVGSVLVLLAKGK
jgi:hypothetical protein